MASDAGLNFVRVEIEIGYTMLDLARTERLLLEWGGARQAITNARKALDCAKRFLPMLKSVDSGTLGDIGRGIDELESAIQRYDAER